MRRGILSVYYNLMITNQSTGQSDSAMNWNMNDTDYVELENKAEALVRERIRGMRKNTELEPNYLHSFRVRDMVNCYRQQDCPDSDLSLAATLHDIVEHGGTSFRELRTMGFSDRTVELVRLCTYSLEIKDPVGRWFEMLSRLVEAGDEDGWRIKLAEAADNMIRERDTSLKNWRFMVEKKAPILLSFGRTEYSAYDRLEEELGKQRKIMESMRRYAVTKWTEACGNDGSTHDFKVVDEFDNKGDAFLFAITATEYYVRNQLAVRETWEEIERSEESEPLGSMPNRFNQVVLSRQISRKDKTGANSMDIFVDVVEMPFRAVISEKMFNTEDCGYEVRGFFDSGESETRGNIFRLIDEDRRAETNVISFQP